MAIAQSVITQLPVLTVLTLAQSAAESAGKAAGKAASDTANQTRQILSKITGTKIIQAVFILIVAYGTIKLVRSHATDLGTVILLMNLFLNLSRENVLAVTGTVAVALGFAFKDYASSIIAGIVGLFEAPYRVGDRISIDDEYGEVISYGLRGIRVRTPSDNIVTVPGYRGHVYCLKDNRHSLFACACLKRQ